VNKSGATLRSVLLIDVLRYVYRSIKNLPRTVSLKHRSVSLRFHKIKEETIL